MITADQARAELAKRELIRRGKLSANPINENPPAYGGVEGLKRFGIGGPSGYFTQPGSEDVLPMVGQTAGGMIPGINTFGGSVAGATAGQAARQGIRKVRGYDANLSEIPAEAARTAAIEGLMRGTGKLLKPIAGRLMNNVLMPGIKQISKGKNLGLEAAEAGIAGTKKGILKQSSKMVEEGEKQLQDILSKSSGKVNLPKALKALDDLDASYTRIGNKSGLTEIENLREAIKGNLSFGSFGEVPISEANVLKRDLYNILKESSYGTGEVSPAVAVRKTVARGLKEGIEEAEPSVKGINQKIGLGGRVRDAIEKRMAQEQKHLIISKLGGMGAGAVALSGRPDAALGILLGDVAVSGLRSAPVFSNTAKLLASLAKKKGLGTASRLGASEFGRKFFGK